MPEIKAITRFDLQRTPLLTDLYQLNMMQAYLEGGRTELAVFELFFRKLPSRRGFLLAAGLAQALEFLEGLCFQPAELDWLLPPGDSVAALSTISPGFASRVMSTPCRRAWSSSLTSRFQVTASLPEAQLVETRLINLIHFQTVIASKAARMVNVAPEKLLVDFGLRRAHGSEAGLLAARAATSVGLPARQLFSQTANSGFPLYGTMAHAFIQAFDDETEAFQPSLALVPSNLTLLIDTYDTEAGARSRRRGSEARGGGDRDPGRAPRQRRSARPLAQGARDSRCGWADETQIFASGGLDEVALSSYLSGAPIEGFGIGTRLNFGRRSRTWTAPTSSRNTPAFRGASARGQSHLAGPQAGLPALRRGRPDGGRPVDAGERSRRGRALIVPVMREGRRLTPAPSLAEARARAAGSLARLPLGLRALTPRQVYPVEVAAALTALAAAVDRRLAKA